MSDDTNLDNRLAQGRWESVHANDFAPMDTPEQRIGFLKELLGNLKKDIGEAKGRPRAVTAEDARILAEGGRNSELKHCVDREGLLARLEQESLEPTPRPHERRSLVSIVTEAPITGIEWEPIMRDLNATWQADFEPECRKRLELRKPGCPESEKREYLEIKKQEYLKVRKGEILKIKRQRARELLELAPRYWAAQDRQIKNGGLLARLSGLEADQRFLITMLGKERREESHASPPPQPLSEEAPEPEDTQDRQEIPVAEVEKIDFKGSKRQLIFLWERLGSIDNGLNLSQYQRRWDLLSNHFTVNGGRLDAHALSVEASKMHKLGKNQEDMNLLMLRFLRHLKKNRMSPQL